MNYFTLAAAIMLVLSISPYLARGEYSWYFSWKNTLTTFLLLSSPFAFYVAAKEEFGVKAWAHFALGLAGYVGVPDTDTDMACHALGSLVFSLHFLLHRVTKRNLLMGTLVKDAKAIEMNTVFSVDSNTSFASEEDVK